MQVAIVIFGAREPMLFDYDIVDGFKPIRIVRVIGVIFMKLYIILDHTTFACLMLCTIYEPVFMKKLEHALSFLFFCFKKKEQFSSPVKIDRNISPDLLKSTAKGLTSKSSKERFSSQTPLLSDG